LNEFRSKSINFRQSIESKIKKNTKKQKFIKKYLKTLLHFFSKNKIIKKTLSNYSDKLDIKHIDLKDNGLPKSFVGFKILFISDLHLDIKPNSIYKLKDLDLPEYDLLVFGGDIFDSPVISQRNIKDFNFVFNQLKTKKNVFIFGNHDSIDFIKAEKHLNLQFLINESISIQRGEDKIIVTGIDDITLFQSQFQKKCLVSDPDIYKICLSHNPDFLTVAEKYNYNLQLSGHTHGGQVKLPFNFILFPHTKFNFAISGLWKYKEMQGITTSGFGCSSYPLRNINPEIILITLN